jgi:hypothetical protein
MFLSQAPNVLVIQLKVRKTLLSCVYDCTVLIFYIRLVYYDSVVLYYRDLKVLMVGRSIGT